MSAIDTDEAIVPDQVTQPDPEQPATSTDLVPAEGQPPTALAAAADAALAMPGAAGHDEFWSLAAQARILSMSGAAPKLVRENPHIALHVALVGRDLGISPSAALELIDVIETGGQPRLSLSPQLLNGQIRRLGLGEVVVVERSALRCVAAAIGPGGTDRRCRRTGVLVHVEDCTCDVLGYTEFTWEDAREAGLVGPKCMPAHDGKPASHPKEINRGGRQGQNSYKVCGCNQGYITYPKRMLWWRASGFAADDYFPEAGLGLYTAEELGSVVDGEGRPIDVASVEVPPGYEQSSLPRGRGGSQQPAEQPAAERRADPDELWELQLRLHALPDEIKATLRERWAGDQSRVKGFKPADLPASKLKAAQALVTAHWAEARAAGEDMEQRAAQLRKLLVTKVYLRFASYWAPQSTVDSPEPAPAPEPPDQAPEAQEDDPGGQPSDVDGFGHDWGPTLKFMSDEAKAAAAALPPGIGDSLVDEIDKLHWARVNAIIAEAGHAADYPPESPINLRRMVVFTIRAAQFAATGEVPQADSP